MKTLIAVAVVAWVALGAGAQPAPEERNAAVRYGMFWAVLGWQMPLEELAGYNPLFDDEAPEAVLEWLADDFSQSKLDELGEITAMARCDFEMPLEQGVNMLVPHLSSMYGWSQKLLMLDGDRQLENGERVKAIERFIGVMGVGAHAGQDGLGVSANVGMRHVNAAMDRLEPMVETGIGAGSAERILEALDRFEGEDPFGVVLSIELSLEMTRVSALELLGAELVVAGGMEEIRGLNYVGMPRQPATDEERALVAEQMEGVERASEALASAYRDVDMEALRSIGRAISSGKYGELAEIGLYSMTRLRRTETAVMGRIEAMRVALEEIIAEG